MFLLEYKSVFRYQDYNKIPFLLLHSLYEKGLILKNDIINLFNSKPYPFLLIDILGFDKNKLSEYNISKKEKELISAHDYIQHKKGCNEGHSQSYILCAIRDDDVESVQKYFTKNTKTTPKDLVPKDEYEKCSLIDNGQCSYIDYSAFFGSIKCFKYFFINETNYNYSMMIEYSIAGGNKEIIHHCIKQYTNFTNAFSLASKFHQFQVAKWLKENKYVQFTNQTIKDCLDHFDFISLEYILEDGFSLFDLFILSVCSNNSLLYTYIMNMISSFHKDEYINRMTTVINFHIFGIYLYFHKILINIYDIPLLYHRKHIAFFYKAAIHIACENENIEIIKLLLLHPSMNINICEEIILRIYKI